VSDALEDLVRSYRRLSADVGSRVNFACDASSEDAFSLALREKDHLDQAFFVLCFAALEKQINLLASARQSEAMRITAMREAKFEQRVDAAIKVAIEVLGSQPEWANKSSEIDNWYDIRNDVAHGEPPTVSFEVPTVVDLATKIAVTLEEVKTRSVSAKSAIETATEES